MYNARIRTLRDAIAAVDLNKTAPEILPTVTAQLKEHQTELAGLLADRRERIAMRFHAQFINALLPLVKSKKELEKLETGGARLAELAITHADELCTMLDKANS